MKKLYLLVLTMLFSVYCSIVVGQTDNNWMSDFDGKVEGDVYDIVKSSADGKFYFCGGFLTADGSSNNKNLVRWDKNSKLWEQVPGINSGHSGFIRCMATDANGDIYMGGDFANMAGSGASRVAKFEVRTGTWKALKDGTFFEADQLRGPNSGGVYAIAVTAQYVYMGGYTFNSSDAAYRYIRRYNLSTKKWESVGTGVNNKVTALAVDNLGNLYAGGIFTTAGGTTVNNIAKWTGTAWQALGSGTDGAVLALEWYNGKLYVGGEFTTVNGNIASAGVAAWNGTSWEAMNKGVATDEVQDIAVDSDGKIYICGSFDKRLSDNVALNKVAVYNGTDWTAMGSGLSTSSIQVVIAAYADGKDVYFGGNFANPITSTSQNQALWNSTIDFTQDFVPACSVASLETAVTQTTPFSITVKFSEDVTGFDIGDVKVTNGTASNLSLKKGNRKWTFNITPTADGIVTVKIDAAAAKDATNKDNTASNIFSIEYKSASTINSHWFTGFDGKVEGEVFDIIKSTADSRIYMCGGFLSVGGNTDMKNIVRYDPLSNAWEKLPGINSEFSNFIRCMVTDANGDIYMGGDFSTVDGLPVGKVAKFEVRTGTWKSLKDISFFETDQTRGPSTGGVYAIALSGNYLYIGGYTFNSTDAAYRYIRRFNLTTNKWENVGGGVDYKISAFAVDNLGNLYAGGSFTQAGGITVNGVAKWNGTAWSALGEGVSGGAVYALEWYNGKLYVGGDFSKVGNNIVSRGIAAWTGSAWESLDQGVDISSGSYSIHDIAVNSDGKLYIGGNFDMRFVDDAKINHVAVFENNRWEPLGSGMGTTTTQNISAVYADGKDIYVGGTFNNPVAGGLQNQAIWNETFDNRIDRAPGVSIFSDEDNPTTKNPFIAYINFSEEVTGFEIADIVPTNATLSKLEVVSPNKKWRVTVTPTAEGVVKLDIAAGAATATDAGAKQSLVARQFAITYQGGDKNWFFDFDGIIEGEVYAIEKSPADGKVYFAGGFLSVGGNTDMKNFVRWDPATNTWEQVPGIDYAFSNFIRCIAADSNGDLYIGGDFSSVDGIPVNRVAKFEVRTGTWKSLKDETFAVESQRRGPDAGGVYDIILMGDYVYIGGWTFNSDNAALRYIRRFNVVTNKWEAVGTGVDAKVSAFATDGAGNLYVGGVFTTAGGVAVNNVAKWNGTSWSALGSGVDASIESLAWGNNKLYAAGWFTKAGGNLSKGIAAWNGSAWEAMGKGIDNSGIEGSVQDVVVDSDGKVYISGNFDLRYTDDARVNHVAVFENNDWQPLGMGLASSSTQSVNVMFRDGKTIYFGGAFTRPLGGLQNQAIWNPTIDYTIDTPPAVSLLTSEKSPTKNTKISVQIKFSEEVTGFTTADLKTTNATVSNLTINETNRKWTAEISPIDKGAVSVWIDANSASDNLSKPNLASAVLTILYDNTLPNLDKNWFLEFDGIIEGEVYDILKSPADGKIYFCGGFLSVGGNTDMKNLVRWVPQTNTWEQVPGIDYTHANFIRCMVADANGDIYMGGDFSTIGGMPARKVAKFEVRTGKWVSLKDETFATESQTRGPDAGGVYAIEIMGDYVYIGGWTFNSDNPALRYIRRFNTVTKKWEAVGSGVDAKVSAFAKDGAGNLYVGGVFTTAGGLTVSNLAKWNGTSWSNVGGGVNASIESLTWGNNKLYVAGWFTEANGNPISTGIAAWNGVSWETMGKGVDNSGITPNVQDVVVDSDGKVYIGGYFDIRYSDDAKVNHVAVFENNDWQPLGAGLASSTTQGINAMFVDGKSVYFGGAFTKPQGGLQNQAIWNPTIDYTTDIQPAVAVYTSEKSPTGNTKFTATIKFTEEVTDFAMTDIVVTNGGVVGLTNKTTNRVWEADIVPLNNGVVGVSIPANAAKDASGKSNIASSVLSLTYDSNLPNINKNWFFDFNGKIDGEVFGITKSSADNKVYFCGGFLSVNGNTNMKNLARWVPSTNTWEQVPGISSSHYNFIRCMVADASGNLYVGGDFSSIGGVSAGRVAKFEVATGTWKALEDPTFFESAQKKGPSTGGVYAIAIMGDYVYIGGWTFNSTNAAYSYIRRFNITTNKWEAVGTGVDAKVSAFATDGAGNLYAGGVFTTAGGVAVNGLAKWNGTSWSDVGGGLVNGSPLALAWGNSKLYVGGDFSHTNTNVRVQGITAWNGTSWESFDKGIDNSEISISVQDLVLDSDGKLYIGGYFDMRYADDARLNHVAVWENNQWKPLGDGLASSSTQGVNAMFADGKNIYFGGAFTKPAGGQLNQALWNEGTNYEADVAPVGTINAFDATSTYNTPIPMVIQFSEDVNGFDITDITVTNGAAQNLVQVVAKRKWTFNVLPTAAGKVTVAVRQAAVSDLASKPNAEIKFEINFQIATTPVITIKTLATNPTYTTPINFTIEVNEDVSGMALADVSVTNGTASNLVELTTNRKWSVVITPTAAGKVTITIPQNAVSSSMQKGNAETKFEITFAVQTYPKPTITSTATSPTQTSPIPVTIEFDEDANGFAIGDISVTNGTAASLVQVTTKRKWTVNITPTAAGVVTVTIPANAATSNSGNPSVAGSFQITYSPVVTQPTLTITSAATSPTQTSPIPITIEFNEVVNNFVIGDISVTNGAASNLVQVTTNRKWTVSITPTASGVVTVTVPAGVATNGAGGENVAATYAITYEKPNAINNTVIESCTIYPNPTKGQVYIKTDATKAMVEIYDLRGVLVMSKQLEDNISTEMIDINHLPQSVYIIKISSDKMQVIRKLIKE